MSRRALLAVLAGLWSGAAPAAGVEIRTRTGDLTLSEVWRIDPGALNPATLAVVVEFSVGRAPGGSWFVSLSGLSRPSTRCSAEESRSAATEAIEALRSSVENQESLLLQLSATDPFLEVRLEKWKAEASAHVAKKISSIQARCEGDLPTTGVTSETKVTQLARMPSRVWDQNLSARVSVRLMGREMSGHFLIDPESRFSAMSPLWLEAQGGGIPIVVSRLGERRDLVWGRSMGPTKGAFVPVQRLMASSVEFPIQGLFLFEGLDLYAPPAQAGDCCDGLLGQDFLSRYSVLFWPRGVDGDAPHLAVLDPKDLNMGSEWAWTRVSRTSDHALKLPDCGNAAVSTLGSVVRGSCLGVSIARLFKEVPTVLDLPNGRLWVRKRDGGPKPRVEAGFRLEFGIEQGDRVLRLKSTNGIEKERLARLGIHKGAVISRVAGFKSTDLDQSEVNAFLRGALGRTVELEFVRPGAQARKVLMNLEPTEKRSRL